jgi:hypothetical protein
MLSKLYLVVLVSKSELFEEPPYFATTELGWSEYSLAHVLFTAWRIVMSTQGACGQEYHIHVKLP